MDHQGPESKRPRLSSTSSWSAGSSHHGVSLPHLAPPHHPTSPAQYQPPSHPFPRPSEPPHPPPPLQAQSYDDRRRHHEYDSYHPPPPRQDLRQDLRQPLPPSPARPRHLMGFPSRLDTSVNSAGAGPGPAGVGGGVGIKRDPGEDTLPHLRRPNSTGNAPEHGNMPGTPQGPPPHQVLPHPPLQQPLQQGLPHPGLPPQQQPHSVHQPHVSQPPHQSLPPGQGLPPHQPHQQPPPPNPMDDQRRQMSFDERQGPPHQSPMQRHPSYPPPTPLPPATPYEPPPHLFNGPPSAGPDGIYLASYSSSATAKRKAQRASQACDNCRQLKAKCDETKPCKNCREKKVECKYRDPIPKQQDKFASDILEGINFIKDEFSVLRRLEQRLENIERHLKLEVPPESVKREPEHDDYSPTTGRLHESPLQVGPEAAHHDDEVVTLSHDDEVMEDAPVAAAAASSFVAVPDPGSGPVQTPGTEMASVEAIQQPLAESEEEPEEAPGSPVPPGQPSIAINHKTPAGLLLRWPAINHIVQQQLEAEGITYAGEYPLRQEEQRGLLRLFGRGEGRGEGREAFAAKDPNSDFGQVALPVAADSPEAASSPMPSGDQWGFSANSGSGPYSPGHATEQVRPGKISSTSAPSASHVGELDFRPDTVAQLMASYEKNIQNMHPIIMPGELKKMVGQFVDNLPTRPPRIPTAGFTEEMSNKRKRSPVPDGGSVIGSPTAVPLQKLPRPYRTISNAVVLCVLALGKICAVKDRLPDPVPDDLPGSAGMNAPAPSLPPPPAPTSAPAPHGSPALRNGFPASPIQGSQGSPPSLTSNPHTSAPSPRDPERFVTGGSSRRASVQGPHPGVKMAAAQPRRNMDVIPGLDYFSLATDIIGNQLAGCTINHVWANVLAGLYYGQLGRVLESYQHICLASRIIQQLLRPHFSRLSQHTSLVGQMTARDNRYTLAFWTCLQLESDILAELPLPQSGILQYEEKMPYPSEHLTMQLGIPFEVMRGYLAQLFLRKQLNTVHKELYTPSKRKSKVALIKELSSMLDQKLWCSKGYLFEDKDLPSDDFLHARLRAKYWGARVITYRPIIRAILNMPFHRAEAEKASKRKERGEPVEEKDKGGASNDQYDEIDDDVDPEDTEIKDFAKAGILALVESTRAFHNVKDRRLIITNVFGTAHAQWGNLVTLAAVYRDPKLGHLVSTETLENLFSRTIDYLKVVAQPSSALSTDMRILIWLEKELFPHRSDRYANSSFSSTTSGSIHGSHRQNYPVSASPVTPHDMSLMNNSALDVGGRAAPLRPPPPLQEEPPIQDHNHVQMHGPATPSVPHPIFAEQGEPTISTNSG